MNKKVAHVLDVLGFSPLKTWKDWLIALYFAFSLAAIFVVVEGPIWVLLVVVLNFWNASTLAKKLDIPELSDEPDMDIEKDNTKK